MSTRSTVRRYTQSDGREVIPVDELDFTPNDLGIETARHLLVPGLVIGCRLRFHNGCNSFRLLWMNGQYEGDSATMHPPALRTKQAAPEFSVPLFSLNILTRGWHRIHLGQVAVAHLCPGQAPLTDPEEFDIGDAWHHLPGDFAPGPGYGYRLRSVQPESVYYVSPAEEAVAASAG
jgi:hypothetical protein